MSNLISYEVVGTAMEPVVYEGQVVTVDPNELPAANGKDLGVFIVNDELYLAKHTRYGKQIIILQENGPHRVVPAAYVEFLGKVVKTEENHSAGNTAAFA